LRAQIDRLAPKADAYEKLSVVLNLLPKPSQSYGVDLAFMMEKEINKLREATP
jgi:hypothetical protein